MFLLLYLLNDDVLDELLDLCVELGGRVYFEVVEVAELLSEANQEGLLDEVAFVDKGVNFHDTNTLFLLVLLDHFRNFFKQLIELPSVDFLLQQAVKDLVHDDVSVLGWS